MAEYGPFSLSGDQQSGAGLDSAVAALRQRYPDLLGLTSYAGAPGSLSALGFSSPRSDLFPGQQPSSLNQLLGTPGPIGQTIGPPESITAQLAQGMPRGGAVTPTGDAGGGAGGMAPGIASPGSDPLGNYGGLSGFVTQGQNATPAAAAGNFFGLSPAVSNTALNVASGVLGLNAVGPLNSAIGLGRAAYAGPATTTDFSQFGPGELGPSAADFTSTAAQNATTTALGLAGPAGAFGNVGFAYSGAPTGLVGPAGPSGQNFAGPPTGRSDTPAVGEATANAPAASPDAEAGTPTGLSADEGVSGAGGGGGGGGGK